MTHQPRRFAFASEVLFQASNEEGVLVELQSGKVFELNVTAARIAQLLADGKSIEQIAGVLSEEFKSEPTLIEKQTTETIQSFLDLGLIVEA